jgi:hypothetical protein
MHNLLNLCLVAATLLLVWNFVAHVDDRVRVELETLNEKAMY